MPNYVKRLNMEKNVFRNDYFLSFCSRFFTIVFGFISLIFLNRFLGTTLKGEYYFILNYVSIVSAVLQFGISMVYPKFKRRNIDNCYEIFVSLSIAQFLLHALISFGIVLIYDLDISIVFICVISPIAALTSQFRYINLVENIRRNTFVVFVMAFINCAVTILSFLLLEGNLVVALAIYIIKDIVIIFLYAIKINYKKLFRKPYVKYYKQILIEGFLPMLSGLLIMLNYRIDTVMLNSYSIDFAAIGVYSLGLSITEYIWVIPDIFKDVVQKRAAKGNPISTVNFSLRCSFTFVFFAFIAIVLLNKNLFIFLFGDGFADSYYITLILFLGAYSMVYYEIIGNLFISDGKSKQYFITLLIGVITNIIVNCAVIPIWGIYGAALASVVSYGGIGVMFLHLYLKDYNVKFRDIYFIKKSDFVKLKRILKNKTES